MLTMEEMSSRADLMRAVLRNLERVREEWSESDVQHVTDPLIDAVNELCDTFAEGGIPGEFRALASRVERITEQWQAFLAGDYATNDRALPGDGFWRNLAALFEEKQRSEIPPPKSIEPVAELVKLPGMQHAQICKMYGWLDEQGRPLTNMVTEELAEPGRHTRDWVHPAERARRERVERERQRLAELEGKLTRKTTLATAVAPEPIGELIQQGLSARQIASMKRLSIEEVQALARGLGLPEPPVDYAAVETTVGQYDKPPSEAAVRAASPAPNTPPPDTSRPAKAKAKPKAKPKPKPAEEPAEDDLVEVDGVEPGSFAAAVREYAAQSYSAQEIATMTESTLERVVEELRAAGLWEE